MGVAPRRALLIRLAIACSPAFAQTVPPPAPSPRDPAAIERAFDGPADHAERSALFSELVAAVRSAPEPEPSEADRARLERHAVAAQAIGVELVSVVGRYNIALVPEAMASRVRELGLVPFLDGCYVLLCELVGFDPVQAKGWRVIHRFSPDHRRLARSNWADLDCQYGADDWADWTADPRPAEWAGNPIHELTHCFFGNAPARFAIEALPGSGEGWPKWTPLYVYSHLPIDGPLQQAADAHREEYRRALERDFESSGGDFYAIAPYDPSGGLLLELVDALAADLPRDPSRALRRAFADLNSAPDDGLGNSPTLSLLRLLGAVRRHTGPDLWPVLRARGCAIGEIDVRVHQRWAWELLPRVGEAAAMSGQDIDSLAGSIVSLGAASGATLAPEVADGGLALLAATLARAGRLEEAESVRDRRPALLRWRFLTGLRCSSWESALDEPLVADEAALTEQAIAPGAAWTPDPAGWLDDTYRLSERLGTTGNDAAYALCEVDWPRDERLEIRLSADDVARVWVNGRAVGDDLSPGPIIMEWAHVIPVDLQRGRNVILVKVANGEGPWGFSARLGPELPRADAVPSSRQP